MPVRTYIVALLCVLCLCKQLQAQSSIIFGRVVSEETGLPLDNIKVTIPKLKRLTTTDSAGTFVIKEIPIGRYEIVFQLNNHQRELIPVVVERDSVFINDLSLRTLASLQEANLNTQDAAPESDAITATETEDRAQNISGVLHAARDPYLNAAAFSFGTLRFQLRGYKRNRQEVSINGSLMNDAETGMAYWGQWGGLNDVFRNQQYTYGLSVAEEGLGGLAGLTSIDATAMRQRKQKRFTYSISNRSYRHRAMATWSTGLLPSGWAVSLSSSIRWANEGYIPGTFYKGFSFFGAVSKKINASNAIHLTVLGAPLQRGKAMAATQEAINLADDLYYNPNWGWQGSQKRNARVNQTFQPTALLTYEYRPAKHSSLQIAAVYQEGYNRNSMLDWYNAQDPRPDYYKKLPSYYLYLPQGTDSTTAAALYEKLMDEPELLQIDWDKLYQVNMMNHDSINGTIGKRSLYVIGEDCDDVRKIGLTANYKNQINDRIAIFIGEQILSQRIESYRRMADLLGGDYYVNLNQFAERSYLGNTYFKQSNLNNPDGIIKLGDKYNYHYIAHFFKAFAWGQVVVSFPKVEVFLGGRGNLDIFSRDGQFKNGIFSNDSEGPSAPNNFFTYNLKGGITYKINGRHYLFLNSQKSTEAPTFDNTYISPRTRNTTIYSPERAEILGVEGGYIARGPSFNGRLTGFYTEIENATEIKRFYHEDHRTFVNYAMRNLCSRHLGVEASLKLKITPSLSTTLIATWMQVFYSDRPTIDIYRDNDTSSRVTTEISYMKNYFVAAGPQSAYSAMLSYTGKKFWYANISANFTDRNYLEVNPVRLTMDAVDMMAPGSASWNAIRAQEKLPAAFTVDLFVGKSFLVSKLIKGLPFGSYLYLNVGVNNILNNKGIITGGFQQLRYDNVGRNPERFPSKYFYAQGINYFINMSLKF
jgi:hypothetical protein